MESFHWHRGFGIRYVSMTGTTTVEQCGLILATYCAFDERKGRELAHGWVDALPESGY
jgi:hypothetical protein